MEEKDTELEPIKEYDDNGLLKGTTDINEQMQTAYLDYAMSVIVSRALPDVRDGLKPVHRRIIYAMQDQNMVHTGKYFKCASVVGEVMKKYHPHGDTAIYDSLVRMAQDFSLRYPLIMPQGNFGSIDGDPPAAMRYTESKLSKIAEELYRDIDSDTVDFELNDLQTEEPQYLPSLLPNLLINGSSGIAVGMATNIPPHNLGEVIDAINFMIDKADSIGTDTYDHEIDVVNQKQILKIAKTKFESSATAQELISYIHGPDFPTGGIIYDQKEIVHMYATGRGRVVTRAKMEIEETKGGKTRIIVKEIPYQIEKSSLLTKIAELVKDKRIEGITDLRDESSRNEIRVVIELKRDAIPKKIENSLYKYTPLQSTFNANIVALLNNEPRLMTLKNILEEFIIHRQQVIIRRTIFLLKKAKLREHILLGLKKALDNLDEIIKLIRSSPDADVAKEKLIKVFDFSDIQAQAILDMQLRRLAALERKKIEDELKEIIKTIQGFEELLASPKLIIERVRSELLELKEKFNDERRTKVVKGLIDEISDEDIIVNEESIITISAGGYIKRMKESAYRTQGRGGTGISGAQLKDEDQVTTIKSCQAHDWALVFTNTGKVYKMRIWEIPEYSRIAKGTPLVNFLSIGSEERVEAFLTLSPEEMDNMGGFVFFVTNQGKVKKTDIEQYRHIRSSGIQAINLTDGDSLVFAGITYGKDDVMITTAEGQSIRFNEADARPMGRTASGVGGIKLKNPKDVVVSAIIIPEKSDKMLLCTVAEKGYGKKTPFTEYKTQNRGGSGIIAYKPSDKTGNLVAAKAINDGTKIDLLIATESGMVIRVAAADIPVLGRATLGVRLIKLKDNDKVTSVAVLEDETVETSAPQPAEK